MAPSTTTVVSLTALCGAVLAAVLGATGFQGRAVVVGVDLGTTFSAVAINAGHRRASISVAADDGGRVSIPSIIAVVNGSWVVGEGALEHVSGDPWRCVFDAKRVIGRRRGDPIAIAENERHRGRLVPHPAAFRNHFGKAVPASKLAKCGAACDADLAFILRVPAAETPTLAKAASHRCIDRGSLVSASNLRASLLAAAADGALASSDLANDAPSQQYLLLTPQAAGCLVVAELLREVSAALGHSTIAGAVAAIPADFTAAQRGATMDAYARNGLTVSRVLFEPAAAAIAYGLHRRSDVRYVVVFDMGGGTTDVSVLYLQDGAFTVIGSAGDGHLGGEDFDDCLVRHMARQLEAEGLPGWAAISRAAADGTHGGAEQAAATAAAGGEVGSGRCTLAWLQHEAERVKIALSGGDDDGRDGSVHTVASAAWSCTAPGGGSRTIRGEISRDSFERECDALFSRTLDPVRDALEAANLRVVEVDEVVLVGGSSRLPRVRTLLRQMFNLPELRATVDPDLAVAIGAALVVD